jgi:3-oxoacyl-[acyl-carrier protein] reductase
MTKIALITGASGGIGSAIAARFAASGYAVVLVYRSNRESIDRLIASLPAGTDYLAVSCDLTDSDSVSDLIEQVHQRLGHVSVLVNCAGTALPQKLFSDTSDDEYHRIFDTNVLGAMRLTRLLTDDLRTRTGSVINISSMWGVSGASCEVIYSASKAALIGFTKALAKELAPCGVTVNCVAPGFVPTAMNAHLSAEEIETFRMETPLERLGTPEDIADAVFYLANARFVTGQILCCDGGYTL